MPLLYVIGAAIEKEHCPQVARWLKPWRVLIAAFPATFDPDWGIELRQHWKERFMFAATTWICFATLILTGRCMQVIYCVPLLGEYRLATAREFVCGAANTVQGNITWGRGQMAMVHFTGAVGLIVIVVLFPYGIWRACRRIVRDELWEDETESAMFGNFYAGFKPRYWWFFVAAHFINDILLSWLGVTLGAYPFYLTVISSVILALYGICICIIQPYEAIMDFGLDIGSVAVALGALWLSEYIALSKGKEPSTLITSCLWFSLVLMIGLTIQGAWPLYVLLQEWVSDHKPQLLERAGLRTEDITNSIKKVMNIAADVQSGRLSTLPARLLRSRKAQKDMNIRVARRVHVVKRSLMRGVYRRRVAKLQLNCGAFAKHDRVGTIMGSWQSEVYTWQQQAWHGVNWRGELISAEERDATMWYSASNSVKGQMMQLASAPEPHGTQDTKLFAYVYRQSSSPKGSTAANLSDDSTAPMLSTASLLSPSDTPSLMPTVVACAASAEGLPHSTEKHFSRGKGDPSPGRVAEFVCSQHRLRTPSPAHYWGDSTVLRVYSSTDDGERYTWI